jgi:acyl carrier protein
MAQLTTIFEDVMDLDDVKLTENSTAADFEEWDSLSHIRLMVAIEKAFKTKFTTAQIEGFKRFGEVADLLEKKGASA